VTNTTIFAHVGTVSANGYDEVGKMSPRPWRRLARKVDHGLNSEFPCKPKLDVVEGIVRSWLHLALLRDQRGEDGVRAEDAFILINEKNIALATALTALL